MRPPSPHGELAGRPQSCLATQAQNIPMHTKEAFGGYYFRTVIEALTGFGSRVPMARSQALAAKPVLCHLGKRYRAAVFRIELGGCGTVVSASTASCDRLASTAATQ